MNRYERYKDSGIPWLGEVPEHWETWKITHAIDLIGSGTTPKSDNAEYYDGDILWVTTSELRENFISDTKQKVSDNAIKEYSALKIYPANSVAMAMYGATIGRLGILKREATFNQACCVFGNSKILYYKFLFYWLWHRRPILISLSTGGGQPNLSQDDLKKLKLPIPSYIEQTAIAHYLDTKLGEIDALIDKQQTLLEKLAEQRTAVITHAVTKGLNPAAPMKKSGVEWLGDVPAHWDIKHSNQIFKIHNGATPKTSEPDYWGDEIVWFTPKDLGDNQNKEISTSLKMITKEGYENCGVSLAPAKSIALSKRAPIGHLAITLLPAVVNQGCFLLEVLAPNDVNYLYYWLYANKTTLNSFGQGSTFMELPREKFTMLKISTPPKDEQTSIAEYLDQETAKIDRLCETVNQTIGRLKEYRMALITQAVTGKIKVTDE